MRKVISTVLICLIVCLHFTACKKTTPPAQNTPNTVTGQWTTQLDMTDTVNQMVYHQIGTETVAFDFPVILVLSLQEDGTYTVDIDREELDIQLDRLGDAFWQTVVDQAATQSQLSSDEAARALLEQGKSKELLMQQLDIVSLFENSYAESGVWKEENGELCFAQNKEMLENIEGYAFTLDDSLTVTYTELNENQETTQEIVAFTRVK